MPTSRFAPTHRRLLVALLGGALALIGWLLAAPVAPVVAATLTVTDCGDAGPGTLRGQIGAAVPGDTIVFGLDCTGATPITLTSGTLAINTSVTIDGTGHAVVVDGGCIANCGTVSAVGGVTVFAVNDRATVVNLTALTIQHGNGGSGSGGGIFNAYGTLTVTNSILSGNSANLGGGIHNYSGTATVTNSTLSGNSGLSGGGGIQNAYGTVTVTNSTLSGNSTSGGGGQGGGITNLGTLTVTNSTLSGNTATHGGGVVNSGGTATVTNSTLSGNSADGYGGGIWNHGSLRVTNSTLSGNSAVINGGGIYTEVGTLTVTNSTLSGNSAHSGAGGGISNCYRSAPCGGTLTVTNSTLSGNSASGGGGIYNSAAAADFIVTVTVTNSTLSGNSTTYGGDGGGIWNQGSLRVTNSTLSGNSTSGGGGGIANIGGGIFNAYGTLTVTNSTLSGNSAPSGAGGGISNGIGTATTTNTIVAGNTSATGGHDLFGAIATGGHNLFGTTGGATITLGAGDLVTATPLLGTLGDNGGPTQTIPLLRGSPAIDAGDDTVCGGTGPAGVNNLDQRGIKRPQGAHCDIGAFELANTPPTLVRITLTGPNGTLPPSTLKVGQVVQITATGTYSDGTTANITGQVRWTPSNADIVRVDPAGVMTGESPGGPVTITATLDGITQTFAVTVGRPTPVGITAPLPPGRPGGGGVPGQPAPVPIPTGR